MARLAVARNASSPPAPAARWQRMGRAKARQLRPFPLNDRPVLLLPQRRERRPSLSLMANVLRLIQADRAIRWRFLAGSQLASARDTDPMLHGRTSSCLHVVMFRPRYSNHSAECAPIQAREAP